MTTHVPRSPYSQEELDKLYPKELELQLVQIILRHGERAPVSARFQNAGLAPYWPYCHAAQRMRSVVFSSTDATEWNSLQWRRRLEKFGEDDGPVIATGPGGQVDGICQLGELTDKGRETTFALGNRLRRLYVDQLQFMPKLIADADMIYLRATPLPRALESVQQAFWGMYPLTARTASFPAPTIITRTPADETLFPNEGNCRRFAQLSRAFAQRAADRWNDTDEMHYLTKMLTKHLPSSSKAVAVDGHPRISGIMDTINSTLAHGPETRLPNEFYDDTVRKSIDKIGTEEWFAGYSENLEYRTLGIGALVGDLVERMTATVEGTRLTIDEIGGQDGESGFGRGGENAIRFAMSGCHDTTIGGILAGMGAFDGEAWPPYTSHLAIELFKKNGKEASESDSSITSRIPSPTSTRSSTSSSPSQPGSVASMLGLSSRDTSPFPPSTPVNTIGRAPYHTLSKTQKDALKDHYVRIRYNDRVMTIPACRKPGNHFEGDESLCTFETFKRVADSFTPENWKVACGQNLDKEAFGLTNKMGDGGAQKSGKIEDGF